MSDAERILPTLTRQRQATNGPPAGPLTIKASQVPSRSIRWAWTGRLAHGYLTVQTGEEGIGKSVFDAWLLAHATRGELDGGWLNEPVNVLVLADEDGIADVWRPRLELAGADLDRVSFLNPEALPPTWDIHSGIGQLRDAITGTQARLMMLDALLDHFPPAKAGESVNSPTFVRRALRPLKELIRELDIVGIFSVHPPKSKGATFRDLVQCSQAFTAVPRVGLYVAWHPEDDDDAPDRRRVVIRGKGNLGRNPGALEFRVAGRDYLHGDGVLSEREVVEDVQPCDVTLADLLPGRMIGERAPTKAERAAAIIAEELADGDWHAAQPIRDRLYREKLNSNTVVDGAKRRVKVQSEQPVGVAHGGWMWRLKPTLPAARSDSETLTPRARDDCDTETLTAKVTKTPLDTVRVSESQGWDRHTDLGPDNRSESLRDTDRARERTADAELDRITAKFPHLEDELPPGGTVAGGNQ